MVLQVHLCDQLVPVKIKICFYSELYSLKKDSGKDDPS